MRAWCGVKLCWAEHYALQVSIIEEATCTDVNSRVWLHQLRARGSVCSPYIFRRFSVTHQTTVHTVFVCVNAIGCCPGAWRLRHAPLATQGDSPTFEFLMRRHGPRLIQPSPASFSWFSQVVASFAWLQPIRPRACGTKPNVSGPCESVLTSNRRIGSRLGHHWRESAANLSHSFAFPQGVIPMWHACMAQS